MLCLCAADGLALEVEKGATVSTSMMEGGVERKRFNGECVWLELNEDKERPMALSLSGTRAACERRNGWLEKEGVPVLRDSLLQASEGLAKQAVLSRALQEW